jgi:hypothetical protein
MTHLQNDELLVEIDDASGALRAVTDRKSSIELVSEPRLAESFRLLVPIHDDGGSYVRGTDQMAASIVLRGTRADIHWEGPLRDTATREIDIAVSALIQLDGRRLSVRLTVVNRSQYRVAEVWYPVIGGVTGVGPRESTRMYVPENGFDWQDEKSFAEFVGRRWHPNAVPEYFFGYPGRLPMPWIDLYNAVLDTGVYIGCHDLDPRYKAVRLELLPGAGFGRDDPWPRDGELEDGEIPAGALISWTLFPHLDAGQTLETPTVAIEFHDGDWRHGAAIFKQWFRTHWPAPAGRPSWMRQEQAFQFTNFLHPEGRVLRRFEDIPRCAREGAQFGVTTLCVYGWNVGGAESHHPRYEPDPRLGTWRDLQIAIRECHKIGVRVIFLVNLQPVDVLIPEFESEYARYVSRDANGYAWPSGYGFATLAARMDIDRRPQVFASPAYPEFRQRIISQVCRLADIGADGAHIDKLAWAEVKLAFNSDLHGGVDQVEWRGILDAMSEMLEACRAINPEFCFSYEGAWDRLMQYTDANWAWHEPWKLDHVAIQRLVFSEWLCCLAVYQPFDFNVVSNAIRQGFQLMVAPNVFTASLGERPWGKIGEYIREALAIRNRLKSTIYLGEFEGETGALLDKDDYLAYGVHLNPESGRRACVIANFSDAVKETVFKFDDNHSNVAVHAPFAESEFLQLPTLLSIPPERFVVVEQR